MSTLYRDTSNVRAAWPMPANMADLIPDIGKMLDITDSDRRNAAVTIAQLFAGDVHAIAFLLTELGLAVHREDGTFSAHMEVPAKLDCEPGEWFTSVAAKRDERTARPFFRIEQGALDNRR